jgi:hypothetical protein
MTTQQLLIRLPDALARRFKRRVPSRARSAFIQRLLEQALPADEGEDDPLYQAALAVEHVNAFPALKDGDFCNQRAAFRPEK